MEGYKDQLGPQHVSAIRVRAWRSGLRAWRTYVASFRILDNCPTSRDSYGVRAAGDRAPGSGWGRAVMCW